MTENAEQQLPTMACGHAPNPYPYKHENGHSYCSRACCPSGIAIVQWTRLQRIEAETTARLAAVFKRMDDALTDYWNACDDHGSCADPECDGDCRLRTWEEFEDARVAARKAFA